MQARPLPLAPAWLAESSMLLLFRLWDDTTKLTPRLIHRPRLRRRLIYLSIATQLEEPLKQIAETATDPSNDAAVQISHDLRQLLADVFALYVKTKNFQWHMSGRYLDHPFFEPRSYAFSASLGR